MIDRERLALRDTTINLPTGKVALSGGAPLIAGPSGIPTTLPLSFDLALDGIGMDQFAILGPPHTSSMASSAVTFKSEGPSRSRVSPARFG